MSEFNIDQLQNLATRIRAQVLKMTHRAKSSHVGSSLSIADLLAVLYGSVLKINPKNPDWDKRDRLILSKGHAGAALYAVLAELGFFPPEVLQSYYQNGSNLAGHITHTAVPGIEVSSGSLGHGLSIACGMALAGKQDGEDYRVFTILSDGECDEGSIWEAVLFAPHHHLDNLIAIVDYNKIQSLGRVEEVLDLEPLADKWKAFGWAVKEIDGHNLTEIYQSMSKIPFETGKSSCLIAHTVKGKGVSFMEDKLAWHYQNPDPEQLQQALSELGMKE